MTNEQLMVLLNSFLGLLSAAIAEVEEHLPPDVERDMTWRYKGSDPLGAVISSEERDPRLWEQVPGKPLCLKPLEVFRDGLASQVSVLGGGDGQD